MPPMMPVLSRCVVLFCLAVTGVGGEDRRASDSQNTSALTWRACQRCHSTREMQRGPLLEGLPAIYLRRCLKSLMLGNPSYHQVSHGDVNHRLAALREELIILVQSPVFVQPTECPLHPPPFGQNHQPFHVVGGLDNLETNLARASKLPHPSDEWPRLGAIGPNTAQAGQLMTQKSQ